jgi:hypothetical protein
MPTFAASGPRSMSKQIPAYVGDQAIERLLMRYRCPTPFHTARMRLWGAIASPLPEVSPVAVLASLWGGDPPAFANVDETNAFVEDMMSFWNMLAALQDGSPPLKLQKIDDLAGREPMRKAAAVRVDELLDGFMRGFMGGHAELDVPQGVARGFIGSNGRSRSRPGGGTRFRHRRRPRMRACASSSFANSRSSMTPSRSTSTRSLLRSRRGALRLRAQHAE